MITADKGRGCESEVQASMEEERVCSTYFIDIDQNWAWNWVRIRVP